MHAGEPWERERLIIDQTALLIQCTCLHKFYFNGYESNSIRYSLCVFFNVYFSPYIGDGETDINGPKVFRKAFEAIGTPDKQNK